MDYGDILFMNASKNLLDKLQRVQNRALKVCLKVKMRTSTVVIHTNAKVNYLCDRRRAHALVEGYKRSKKKKYLRNINVNIRRASATLLKNSIPKKELYKRSVEYTVSVLWNALEPDKRNAPDIESFRSLIKTDLRRLIPDDT